MIRDARLLRLLLTIDLIALLFAVSLATVTASGPAQRTLGRSIAVLSEVDTYLDEHYAGMQQQAQQAPDAHITAPDFPVDVSFTAPEVNSSREGFRSLLLRRSAAVLHDEGTTALRQGRPASTGANPGGLIRAGMELLRPLPHAFLVGLSVVFGLAALALVAAMSRASSGIDLRSLGAVMLASSAMFLTMTVVLWIILRAAVAGTNDYVANEFLTLVQRLALAPIRDGLIVMVGGAAVAVAGVLLAQADRGHAQRTSRH